ncbi:MAG: hypothetical protein M3Q89_11910 [Verrucomicrobiota bacterium]|nr:hypothetical protein [Verrucomicrobiota bacterium]
MQSHEAEPVERDLEELKNILDEWRSIASELIEMLRQTVDHEESANWGPHVTQIDKVLRQYRDLCDDESQQLGLWREDGLQPDEVYEVVWNEGDRLAQWLTRMTAH